MEVLAPDVVLRSDGGGVVTAALHPVRGADKVARFVTGLLAKVDRYFPGVTFRFEEATVNGAPGVLLLLPGGVALRDRRLRHRRRSGDLRRPGRQPREAAPAVLATRRHALHDDCTRSGKTCTSRRPPQAVHHRGGS